MAIKLEDKPNTYAPDADYPYGNIQDNTGSNNGTPVNTLVYADLHQFFAKMMDESAIVYNDQPDNATNGFQYWLALIESIKNNSGAYIDATSSITLNVSFTSITKKIHRFYNGLTRVSIKVVSNTTIAANSTLASGFIVPASTEIPIRAIYSGTSGYSGIDLVLNSSGNIVNLSALTFSGSTYAVFIHFIF